VRFFSTDLNIKTEAIFAFLDVFFLDVDIKTNANFAFGGKGR